MFFPRRADARKEFCQAPQILSLNNISSGQYLAPTYGYV